MEYSIQKKSTLFRLDANLVDRLKELAKSEHRSLNNFVEYVLYKVAYRESSEDTLAAIEEAKSGKLDNVRPLDLSSPEAMFKSMDI